MSTSCTVTFIDNENEEVVAVVYKHMDGDTFMAKLKEFYKDKQLVMGLSMKATNEMNGIPDAAAQAIAEFKKGPGDLYLVTSSYVGDYNYEVRGVDGKVVVQEV